MIRISHVLLLLMAVWSAGLLVWTGQSVQRAEKNLKNMQYEKMAEAETVRVLLSEWEYLNRPDRLEVLVQQQWLENNAPQQTDKLLISVNEIRNPSMPSVPLQKPENLLQYVSMQKSNTNKKSNFTPASERKEFETLIDSVLAQGGTP